MKKKKLRVKWNRVFIALAITCCLIFGIYKGVQFVVGQIVSLFTTEEVVTVSQSTNTPKNYIATVVIDPGHGGSDPGTNQGDILEKDINLTVAKTIQTELDNQNIKAVLTRDDDSTPNPNNKISDLRTRAQMSATNQAQAFVSIHVNSYDGSNDVSGFEFYTRNDDSLPLAQAISSNLEKLQLSSIRNIQDGHGLQVLRDNSVDAVLVELGYLNGSDYSYLTNDTQLNNIAKAIASGIASYIND